MSSNTPLSLPPLAEITYFLSFIYVFYSFLSILVQLSTFPPLGQLWPRIHPYFFVFRLESLTFPFFSIFLVVSLVFFFYCQLPHNLDLVSRSSFVTEKPTNGKPLTVLPRLLASALPSYCQWKACCGLEWRETVLTWSFRGKCEACGGQLLSVDILHTTVDKLSYSQNRILPAWLLFTYFWDVTTDKNTCNQLF